MGSKRIAAQPLHRQKKWDCLRSQYVSESRRSLWEAKCCFVPALLSTATRVRRGPLTLCWCAGALKAVATMTAHGRRRWHRWHATAHGRLLREVRLRSLPARPRPTLATELTLLLLLLLHHFLQIADPAASSASRTTERLDRCQATIRPSTRRRAKAA